MEVAAVDGDGYLGMIPEGWDTSILAKLSQIQSEEAGLYMKRLAGDFANRMESPVILENVNVVDVVSGRLLEGHYVLVNRGKIAAISEARIESADAIRIDGTGKSLMPGLWDMHGHFSLSDGVLNIAGGVTNVRDIGNVHDKIMELTAKYDSGEVIGPNTFRAGFLDKAGPYASGWAAETLEAALDRIDFFAQHGYIQIKLYSSIEPEWVAPIAERAHSHGMRLSGHIPAFMSAEQAVRAGYDEIQHINMVFLNFSAGDREDTRKQIRFTLYGDEAGNLDLESQQVQDFFALLKDNDVVIDPTVAIFDTQLRHLPGNPDPTFAAVIEHLPASIARALYNPAMDMGDMVDAWGRSAENQAAMLKALHDNGIQLVPGSDNIAAFTLHREIELYSEAGIPNADVLRIATLESARVTGVADRKGSIEVDKDSDLILLDGNPFEDISAIRRAVLVMKGDTLFQPDRLYKAVGVKPFLKSVDF
jgi:imidazolonepropionase-like amidohydrolase